MFYTKTQNGVAIFEKPYWVWFLILKSVVTLS